MKCSARQMPYLLSRMDPRNEQIGLNIAELCHIVVYIMITHLSRPVIIIQFQRYINKTWNKNSLAGLCH